ncbi:D-galactarate dehydratase domain protein [Shigella flexneri 1235-66]|nr:D-galactarate dehydratase domain protein [Shigella flexneri 1235-66]
MRDAIHLLTPRAVNEEVGKRLLEEMEWYDNYLNMGKPTAAPTLRRATRKAVWQTW